MLDPLGFELEAQAILAHLDDIGDHPLDPRLGAIEGFDQTVIEMQLQHTAAPEKGSQA